MRSEHKQQHARMFAREEGMTLVEVVVAALIFVIGALAILQTFDSSTRSAYRAEQSQVLNSVAERELEEIRRLPFAKVALASPAPTSATAVNDPRHRVSGTRFALNRSGTALADMVINGGGLDTDGDGQLDDGTISCGSACLVSGPEPFSSGDVKGNIYRYVVWQDDVSCGVSCPGAQDVKRAVVAIRLDGTAASAERPYHEVQSDLIDPVDNAQAGLPPPGNPPVTAQQLHLSDTTCNNANRIAITADHAAHNTLGVCSDGLRSGTTAGAPDLLFTAPTPASQVSFFDYANDFEPAVGATNDRGLQLQRQATPGCDYTPEGNGAGHQIHRWVTPPVPLAFVLEGDATLQLYTRTLNGATHPGKICVYLFRREDSAFGGAEDELIVDANGAPNQYFTWSQLTWPRSATPGVFGQVIVPMEFDLTVIPRDQRLGIAISVEQNGTGADALEFGYDHPSRQSRLEVQTATPLPASVP